MNQDIADFKQLAEDIERCDSSLHETEALDTLDFLTNGAVSNVTLKPPQTSNQRVFEQELVGKAVAQVSAGSVKITPAEAKYMGELTAEDIAKVAVWETEPSPEPRRPLVRLHQRHHHAAQLLAANQDIITVAEATGYTPTTLRNFMVDPAFLELMEHYTDKVEENIVDLYSPIKTLVKDSVNELQDRLENSPEAISSNALIEVVKAVGPMVGLTAVTRQENIVLHTTADELKMLKDSANAAQQGKVNNLNEVNNGKEEKPQGDREAGVGGIGSSTERHVEAEWQEVERVEGKGQDVRESGGSAD